MSRCQTRTAVRKRGAERLIFFLLIGWVALGLIGSLLGCAGLQSPRPVPVTLLFFNDLHGYLSPFKIKTADGVKEVGGIARMATVIRQIREENASRNIPTIVLVAGDILQGTPMSTVFRGEPDTLALNEMGVDALTVGNHEFDFGLENFLTLKAAARFPFLSGNIYWKGTQTPLCDAGAEFQLTDSLWISVLGVTTDQLVVTTLPANVDAIDVHEPVVSLAAAYDQATRKGPVVLLSHSRHQTDRALAETYPKLSAIIGGHDQILMDPYRQVADVPIFQAFEKGRFLGRLDFAIDPVTFKTTLRGWAYIPIDQEISADEQVSEIVERYQARLDTQFKVVIGRAAVFLDAERERIRYEETNLGDWVTDIMRRHTGADIALLNSGSLRASIPDGPVTIADVFRAMPYENTLVTTEISGEELQAVLNRSVMGTRADEDGGFLQVSGISFSVREKRAENIRVGEAADSLQPEKRYSVVITDFMASGGDGYAWFKEKSSLNTQLPLRELIIDTIGKESVIQPPFRRRIDRTSP